MRLFILIFLSFAILMTTAIIGAVDVLSGNYKIDIDQNFVDVHPHIQNYNRKFTGQGTDERNYPVTVGRRHVIPKFILQNFYNRLVEKGEAWKLPSFFTQYLEIFNELYDRKGNEERNPHKYDETIEKVNKLVLGLLQNVLKHDPNARKPEKLDEFLAFYMWLPGNLFVCPMSWDPNIPNFLESDLKLDRIMTPARFQKLQNVYNMMKSYINDEVVNFEHLDDELNEIAHSSYAMPLDKSFWTIKNRICYIKEDLKDMSGFKKFACTYLRCLPFINC